MNNNSNNKQDYQPENNNRISQRTREHLQRVYFALTGTTASAATGAYLQMRHIVYLDPTMTTLVGFLLLLGISMTRPNTSFPTTTISTSTFSQETRLVLLLLFGLMQGFSLGPLLGITMFINPSIVFNTIVATLLIFGSFSASALFAQRRSYLFLGGLLGSGLSILFLMNLMQLFFGGAVGGLGGIEMYLALIVFSGFVAYDTQRIIERSENGSTDYVSHSVDLFLDLVNLFIRLLELFSNKEEDRRDRRSSSSRKHRRLF